MRLHERSQSHTIQMLLDTECSIPNMSREWARKAQIQLLKREQKRSIKSYTGQTIPEAGKYYTQPILLQHRKHYTWEAFEVSAMEPRIVKFLPF